MTTIRHLSLTRIDRVSSIATNYWDEDGEVPCARPVAIGYVDATDEGHEAAQGQWAVYLQETVDDENQDGCGDSELLLSIHPTRKEAVLAAQAVTAEPAE